MMFTINCLLWLVERLGRKIRVEALKHVAGGSSRYKQTSPFARSGVMFHKLYHRFTSESTCCMGCAFKIRGFTRQTGCIASLCAW